jgi:hypothetical protein
LPFIGASLSICLSLVESKFEQEARTWKERRAGCSLDINDDAKEIVQEIGAAINAAVERSPEVAEAIERLREAGYEMELTLRLEIGLRAVDDVSETPPDETAFDLTDDDRQTLRSMKIRIDESE